MVLKRFVEVGQRYTVLEMPDYFILVSEKGPISGWEMSDCVVLPTKFFKMSGDYKEITISELSKSVREAIMREQMNMVPIYPNFAQYHNEIEVIRFIWGDDEDIPEFC